MLLARLLEHLIQQGTLTVLDADGRARVFGDQRPPAVTVRLHDKSLERRLFFAPELCVGEAYVDGLLTLEGCDLYAFMDLVFGNLRQNGLPTMPRWLRAGHRLGRRLMQFNPAERARRNAAHHYDLSGDLYNLFLDSDKQYSCAYFDDPGDTLEAAQARKKQRIGNKLRLSAGQRVLDIGSGWGGLSLFLADRWDVEVIGLTLSEEQLRVSRARARDAGLEDRVRFELRDYREQTGTFDRIVSIGMFEHVGLNHFPSFFNKLSELLADDGVALLHTIGRADGPGVTDPWIRRYVFPGGYCPALSEVFGPVERAGLWTTDVEVLRLHYAETLRHWRRRFMAHRANAVALYDERFARLWEYYLVVSELAFRRLDSVVFQIQFAKAFDSLPITRDYMGDRRDGRQAAGKKSERAA